MQDEHFHFLLVSVKCQPSAASKSVAYKIKRAEMVENLITRVEKHSRHHVISGTAKQSNQVLGNEHMARKA